MSAKNFARAAADKDELIILIIFFFVIVVDSHHQPPAALRAPYLAVAHSFLLLSLIAPCICFEERLIWNPFPRELKRQLLFFKKLNFQSKDSPPLA